MTIIKPITTEKAVRLIELENTILFEVDRKAFKPEIKKEIESLLGVKVDNMRSLIRQNKKFVYVRLNKKNLAIDLATKLEMM
ncbi:MAG: 50S ribosomal protein L23 [Candidatus Pacearchaeota archaeon]|nr:50S ribosomal protein L23 [Candidatus Pacearchaeota archaeon]